MTQDRDDYMRRQEADHDLLRMRDPNYASTGPTPPGFTRSQPRRGDFSLSPPAKPGECLLSDMHHSLHRDEKCPECGYCFEDVG